MSHSIRISDDTAARLRSHAEPGESLSHTLNRLLPIVLPLCRMCHDKGTVNFEGAGGWDEPCPKCGVKNAPQS